MKPEYGSRSTPIQIRATSEGFQTASKKRHDEGLIVKLHDIAHQYAGLENRLVESGYVDYNGPEREQLRNVKKMFDSYKLLFIELRGIDVAEVCQIFERVNQAGQPLSMFDIVVAKTFRLESDEVSGFYLRGLLESFRQDLAPSHFAVVDDLTLLQVLAVLVRDSVPDSGVYNITDPYLNILRTEHLESVWEDGIKAILKVFDFFHNHLQLSGPALIPSRYFYMSLASYFFRNNNPDYSLLKCYFWYYSFHNEDLLSNTAQLRDHIQRFKETRDGGSFGFERFIIDRERLRRETYSNRGRLSRAILALYANQRPCDWEHTDRPVLAEVYFMITDHPNLHHIFPSDFCEKHLGEHGSFADSLLNIAYLTQITNLRISNRNPLDYMRSYIESGFAKIQRTHLLPKVIFDWVQAEQMPDDALEIFVEARLEIILAQIRDYLGDIRFDVIDTRAQDMEVA